MVEVAKHVRQRRLSDPRVAACTHERTHHRVDKREGESGRASERAWCNINTLCYAMPTIAKPSKLLLARERRIPTTASTSVYTEPKAGEFFFTRMLARI